ncbi:MAG: putative glycoside hydrolase [Halobacteriota archaeon]
MKRAKRNATKALFLFGVSLLVAGFVIPPVAAASSTTSSGGSNAQSLIHASAPHTYVDFKSSWAGDTAANLAKYDVVALHYTDTAQHIQAIKALNPNAVVLAYFNPLFGGSEGTPHTEWYLRDASGQTHSSGYNEPLMDLTNAGWRAMCVQITQNALQKGFDGLVLDNGLTSPNVLWPGSWSGSDSQWQASTIALYKSIKQAAGSKIVIYNGAYFIPGYVDALDGWMDEGFPFYKGWDNSIGFALDASTKGKLTLFYAQGSASDRYFCYCSALLTDGYFFYAPTGTKWFDDYGIQLGTALNKAEKNADGTWQRDYQYGTVVVNPSSKTARIDLKSGQSAQSAATPTPTPTATSTSKVATTVTQATTTPKVATTVTQAAPTPKVATTVTQAAPTPTATSTSKVATTVTQAAPTPTAASLVATKTTPEVAGNDSVPGISVPAAQTSSVASLPAQPVLEFSLLGLGVPALVAGLVYLLMRR